MLYEMVNHSSLFKSRGNHFTLAKATYLVDLNGLEEFLPLPKVSNFLCSALPAQAHYIINTLCVYLAIIWSGNLSRGSLRSFLAMCSEMWVGGWGQVEGLFLEDEKEGTQKVPRVTRGQDGVSEPRSHPSFMLPIWTLLLPQQIEDLNETQFPLPWASEGGVSHMLFIRGG